MSSILCVRNRLGRSAIEAVLTDFDRNGRSAVQTLREQDPAGYTKVLTDLLAVRSVLRAETGESTKDKGRTGRTRRTRAASKLLAALEQDFALHGQDAITTLRTEKPQAWARLLSEAVQFRLVPKTPKGPPRRAPRPLRMARLVAQMQAPPTVDLDSPTLPPDQVEELLRVMDEVGAGAIRTMTLEGLLQHFDDVMAVWIWRWMGAGRDGRSAPGQTGAPSGDGRDAFGDAPRGEVAGDGFILRR